jgi:hypothetical protein
MGWAVVLSYLFASPHRGSHKGRGLSYTLLSLDQKGINTEKVLEEARLVGLGFGLV